MRVGITINTSWNIYNFRKGLVKTLLAEGHEVVAIAPKDEYSSSLIEWGCQFVDISMNATTANPLQELNIIFDYRYIFKKKKLDIVLSYTIKPNLYASIAAKSCGVPIICNVSGLGTAFLAKGLKSSIAHFLYKFAFKHSNFIFFQNEDDRNDFFLTIPVPIAKTAVIPGSGVDLSAFKKRDYKPKEIPVYLMVARLLIDKGVKEYAEAALALKFTYPDARFLLVGQLDKTHQRSIRKDQLEDWSKKGLEYIGYTDKIKNEYLKADIVVLPSYREGTPKTLLEAAALGTPLIATDVPGCRDLVIDNHNGFLCKAGSGLDLKNKMELFIHLNEDEKRKMAENSRKLVEEKYDEKIVISRYQDKIKELTNLTDRA